jgi:hypothetical protein
MPGSWGREIGGMLQGTGTAGRSFKRRPWLKMGCCADDDDDDDDENGRGVAVTTHPHLQPRLKKE